MRSSRRDARYVSSTRLRSPVKGYNYRTVRCRGCACVLRELIAWNVRCYNFHPIDAIRRVVFLRSELFETTKRPADCSTERTDHSSPCEVSQRRLGRGLGVGSANFKRLDRAKCPRFTDSIAKNSTAPPPPPPSPLPNRLFVARITTRSRA